MRCGLMSLLVVVAAWLGAPDSSAQPPFPLLPLMPAAVRDGRFCGPPPRDSNGRIVRSAEVLRQFERLYPRPNDGRRWYKDHVIPLACGGCDAVVNMQWLPEEQWSEKSKWERKVYGGRGVSAGCP